MNNIQRQHGSTLLIALIILVLLTVIALSAMTSTTTSLQIVGNAQFKEEATTAAQAAIENVISSNFTAAPAASTATVAVGTGSYSVAVEKPVCISSVKLLNGDLQESDPAFKDCRTSDSLVNTGILVQTTETSTTAIASLQSWCYQQQWDIRATVNDTATTQVSTAVHQGVSLKVPAGTTCPDS